MFWLQNNNYDKPPYVFKFVENKNILVGEHYGEHYATYACVEISFLSPLYTPLINLSSLTTNNFILKPFRFHKVGFLRSFTDMFFEREPFLP